jgi:hypothetical protein
VPLVRAVIKVESDYDPNVVSAVGAKGLMQLMPAVEGDMRVASVFEPRDNIMGGTRLLRILANKFDGDLVLTIAAYHAGAGAVRSTATRSRRTPHTRQYVRMVLDRYYEYKARDAAEGHQERDGGRLVVGREAGAFEERALGAGRGRHAQIGGVAVDLGDLAVGSDREEQAQGHRRGLAAPTGGDRVGGLGQERGALGRAIGMVGAILAPAHRLEELARAVIAGGATPRGAEAQADR